MNRRREAWTQEMRAAAALRTREVHRRKKMGEFTEPAHERQCTDCGLTKNLDQFNRHAIGKYGRKPVCRECASLEAKTYGQLRRLTNPKALAANWKRWADKNRPRLRQRARTWAKQLRSEHPEILRARNKIWRLANPEKAKACYDRWHKANPDRSRAQRIRKRARKAGAQGDYTAADIKRILANQEGKCAYFKICGQIIEKNYTVDHITPLSRGGSNWPSNLQLTCRSCNSRKGTKDHIEFVRALGVQL